MSINRSLLNRQNFCYKTTHHIRNLWTYSVCAPPPDIDASAMPVDLSRTAAGTILHRMQGKKVPQSWYFAHFNSHLVDSYEFFCSGGFI